jgi:hypothetical protein
MRFSYLKKSFEKLLMTKDYREIDREKERGRKRYLERLQQTREANDELEEELRKMEEENKQTHFYEDIE